MRRVLTIILRERQGSAVVQAAAVALFVAVLVLAMLGMLDRLQAGVTDSLRCYIGGFDTGGCNAGSTTYDSDTPLMGYTQPPAMPADRPLWSGATDTLSGVWSLSQDPYYPVIGDEAT